VTPSVRLNLTSHQCRASLIWTPFFCRTSFTYEVPVPVIMRRPVARLS
jgi:hypothetical protein